MVTEKTEILKEGGSIDRKHQEMPSSQQRLQASEKEVQKEEAGAHMKCTSCGIKIEAEDKWVKFPCPKCGKQRILRCDKCKRLMNIYECPKCGFTGP